MSVIGSMQGASQGGCTSGSNEMLLQCRNIVSLMLLARGPGLLLRGIFL
jgi:hypothetical protein